MTQALLYTELQIAAQIENAPWQEINARIKAKPGFINKTWLAGVGNDSLGGLYQFESIETAQEFARDYFPTEARSFGVPQTTRIFDADVVAEASKDISSPHFGTRLKDKPGAYLYTEVQVSVPFASVPWQERNEVLKKLPGLLSKTWLSGIHTQTLGGLDAFDTIENARAFAIDIFPETAAKMNAAYTTRLFDAAATEEPSRDMASPFYASS